jgi:hypothetical protein
MDQWTAGCRPVRNDDSGAITITWCRVHDSYWPNGTDLPCNTGLLVLEHDCAKHENLTERCRND